jgi:hypothetical protein
MRPSFYEWPPDNGSRRFQRCPPSHQEMALPPDHAQASARAPRPSQLPTTSMLLAAQVSSPYHLRGSTMPSAAPAPVAHSSRHLVPFASMRGNVPKHSRTIARLGQWHPRPARLLLGRQRHRLPLMRGEVLERCRQPGVPAPFWFCLSTIPTYKNLSFLFLRARSKIGLCK